MFAVEQNQLGSEESGSISGKMSVLFSRILRSRRGSTDCTLSFCESVVPGSSLVSITEALTYSWLLLLVLLLVVLLVFSRATGFSLVVRCCGRTDVLSFATVLSAFAFSCSSLLFSTDRVSTPCRGSSSCAASSAFAFRSSICGS